MADVRGVILDVDGTLVDSNDAHAFAWVEAFKEQGYDVPFEKVRRLIGMGSDNLLPAAAGLDKHQEPGKTIARRWGEIFESEYLPKLQAFPQTRELLQKMRYTGLTLVVASSAKQNHLKGLLQLVGAEDLIDDKTSSDDADRSKPEPDIIASALEKLGLAADEVLMLGDTPYDIEAANKIGVQVVAMRCGGFSDDDLKGAVAIYDSPAQILLEYASSPFASGSRWRIIDDSKATPDQAEGERDPDDKNTLNVARTPGQAEGDRQTVEEDLRNKGL